LHSVGTVAAVTPRTFGPHLRDRWLLDPDTTYLNHGTVGATPIAVLAHQRTIVDEIERHPARFMLRELADVEANGARSRMREAIAGIAPFVGADAADLVFVDNITAGANAVLRSFPFHSGDEIAVTSLGYGGVTNAAAYVARTTGASLRTIELPRPGAQPHEFVEAVDRGLGPATRVLVIDHLTAETALVLPIAEIADACHANGTLVLADGAHVPGNVALDISALGVDWYAANLHKWAWAPRSCGFLWTSPAQQEHLEPNVISWGLDHGMAAEFDLAGTRDPSAWLSAPFAIDHLASYGLDAVYAHNHELAWWAAHHVSDAWGTPFETPAHMLGAMVSVRLPQRLADTRESALRLQAELDRAGIEIPLHASPEGLRARISCQIYNGRDDIERLTEAVLRLR
jgi:isopenicillin-N epimerase